MYDALDVVGDIVAAAHGQVEGLLVREVLHAQELLIKVANTAKGFIAHIGNFLKELYTGNAEMSFTRPEIVVETTLNAGPTPTAVTLTSTILSFQPLSGG